MRSSISEDRTMMRTVQHFVYGDKLWFLMVPSFLSFLIQCLFHDQKIYTRNPPITNLTFGL